MSVDYLAILKKEIKPAVGCTEPVAVAYAAAKAVEVLGTKPDHLEAFLSRSVLKNGQGVGIPGTRRCGLDIAAAMGAFAGNASKGLGVLSSVDCSKVGEAEAFCDQKAVKIDLHANGPLLYIEVIAKNSHSSATVIIANEHTNIIKILKDQTVIYQNKEALQNLNVAPNACIEEDDEWTIASIYNFCITANSADLAFLQEGLDMNIDMAEEGLNNSYGLQVGKTIATNECQNITKENLSSLIIAVTAAASDARMAGVALPVMTTAGSGNQGLTAFLPVAVYGGFFNIASDQLYRAVALSVLVTIHIKRKIGRLSALCGCGVAAAIGSSAALTYLSGGSLKQINFAIKTMIGDLSGLVCDGAKSTCALKIATSLSSATRAVLLAMNNPDTLHNEGILVDDVEQSINHLAILGSKGMSETDKTILELMLKQP